jgi:hypothetical protein
MFTITALLVRESIAHRIEKGVSPLGWDTLGLLRSAIWGLICLLKSDTYSKWIDCGNIHR